MFFKISEKSSFTPIPSILQMFKQNYQNVKQVTQRRKMVTKTKIKLLHVITSNDETFNFCWKYFFSSPKPSSSIVFYIILAGLTHLC